VRARVGEETKHVEAGDRNSGVGSASDSSFQVAADWAWMDEVYAMTVPGCADATCCASVLVKALIVSFLVLGVVITPSATWAQARANVPRVSILSFGTAPSGTDPDPNKRVLQGLREHGYVEGRNILIERRYAEGRPDRLAAQAAELVRLNVDVILAGGPTTREAARKATTSIPIVTISGSDPSKRAGPKASRAPAATSLV